MFVFWTVEADSCILCITRSFRGHCARGVLQELLRLQRLKASGLLQVPVTLRCVLKLVIVTVFVWFSALGGVTWQEKGGNTCGRNARVLLRMKTPEFFKR